MKNKDQGIVEFKDSNGVKRGVKALTLLLACSATAGLAIVSTKAITPPLRQAINESSLVAACLAATGVAIGSAANIMSEISPDVPRAILRTASVATATAFLSVLPIDPYSTENFGIGGLASYAITNGVYASVALPCFYLVAKEIVLPSINKATEYIYNKLRTVSLVTTLKPLLNHLPAYSHSPTPTNGIIEV